MGHSNWNLLHEGTYHRHPEIVCFAIHTYAHLALNKTNPVHESNILLAHRIDDYFGRLSCYTTMYVFDSYELRFQFFLKVGSTSKKYVLEVVDCYYDGYGTLESYP